MTMIVMYTVALFTTKVDNKKKYPKRTMEMYIKYTN